jgi:hypothetical protein
MRLAFTPTRVPIFLFATLLVFTPTRDFFNGGECGGGFGASGPSGYGRSIGGYHRIPPALNIFYAEPSPVFRNIRLP